MGISRSLCRPVWRAGEASKDLGYPSDFILRSIGSPAFHPSLGIVKLLPTSLGSGRINILLGYSRTADGVSAAVSTGGSTQPHFICPAPSRKVQVQSGGRSLGF